MDLYCWNFSMFYWLLFDIFKIKTIDLTSWLIIFNDKNYSLPVIFDLDMSSGFAKIDKSDFDKFS